MTETTIINALLNEKWKELLARQISSDPKEQRVANGELQTAINESHARRSKELWVNEKDIPRLIQIGMTMQFPFPRGVFASAEILVLDWFWHVQHPHVAPAVADFYANAQLRPKMSALVILVVQHTPEALTTLTRLIVQEGFPEHMRPRFFTELNNCSEFADLLLPQLLLHAGSQIGGIVDFINFLDARGKLHARHLRGMRELVEHRAKAALELIKQMQLTSGSRWRYEEAYQEASILLGAYLDLLGHIADSSIEILHAATALSDPRLLLIAAVALLKRGVEPSAAILETVAASHAVRLDLHRILMNLGRRDLFPQTFLSFEAFSASHMVSWLTYPSELGYEPGFLELSATVRGITDEGERQWCLWKFADDEGKTYAGVSGPYELDASLESLAEGDAFSNFTPWEEATQEQHLASVLETLSDWRLSLRAAR
jgi:hypothetical protein